MARDFGDASELSEVTSDYLVRIVDNPNSEYPVDKLIPGREIRRGTFAAEDYGASAAGSAAANKSAIDAALAVADAAGGGVVILPTGEIQTDGAHDLPAGVEVWGAGSSSATVLVNRSATYTFRVMNETSGEQAGGVRRMTILGNSGALAPVDGGIGIELSNGLMHVVEDVFIGGFTGTGSVGVRFHNISGTLQYVEQAILRKLFITNCTTGIQFLCDATAGTSFGYTNFEALAIQLYASQVGIDVGGSGALVADLYSSRIVGEMHYIGDSAVGIKVTVKGSVSRAVELDIRGEHAGGTSQTRILNQGVFYASGHFYISSTQPADDYSTALSHEFREVDRTSAELATVSRTVVAAGVLTVPGGSSVWDVTGTTQINVFAGQTMWEGRLFTLRFTDSVTVQHNASLILLAGAVNFSATANDTLTLMYHDGKGFEVARSVV